MSDRETRRLERAWKSAPGDAGTIERLAAAYVRSGEKTEANAAAWAANAFLAADAFDEANTITREWEDRVGSAAWAARKADWEAANGCERCHGRGWVVTWDTLDSMTGCYHQTGSCPAGEGCTARTTGPKPFTEGHSLLDKYDKFHDTESRLNARYPGRGRAPAGETPAKGIACYHTVALTAEETATLRPFREIAKRVGEKRAAYTGALERAREPAKGKRVRVARRRGRNAPPKGTEGTVFWTGTSATYGTERIGFKTDDGETHWTAASNVDVIDAPASGREALAREDAAYAAERAAIAEKEKERTSNGDDFETRTGYRPDALRKRWVTLSDGTLLNIFWAGPEKRGTGWRFGGRTDPKDKSEEPHWGSLSEISEVHDRKPRARKNGAA